MPLYGQVLYGAGLYGGSPTTSAVAGATPFLPTYAVASGAVTTRGGPDHLDRDISSGALILGATGRPSLARGPHRLVSRVVRALLTPQGDWWADPTYGTTLVLGQAVPADVALAVADVALHEARNYLAGPLAPDERIAGMTVTGLRTGNDPREIEVDVTIATAGGSRFPVTFGL